MTDTVDEDWREVGRAWGERALDWAYLFEPYGIPVYDTVLPKLGITEGTRFLDVACGSGLAATFARRRGGNVSGIDASEELLAIAHDRVPDGDFRVADLYELSFEADSFDVVTSFNGIWYGNDRAVEEIDRVLRPGGTAAITFWGDPTKMDHAAYFIAVAGCSEPSEGEEVIDLGKIAEPGVAEGMLRAAGLEPTERGTARCMNEWPDRDIAARAVASPGVAHHAISHSGLDAFVAACMEAIEPFRTGSGYRLASDIDFVVATKPAG